jgi:ATP-dependent helicase/nuclease subunit A
MGAQSGGRRTQVMSSPSNARASDAQRRAADPAGSAWVAANAGSGKTTVLVNRVIGHLLNGSKPERLLCLTFTKAAAAEMTNRLYERLGAWAVMDEAALNQDLTALTGSPPAAGQLSRARQLFALALETPGGLKIQTIHAFAESLLHRFPLEAGIAPQFEVMDETAQRQLLGDARRAVLEGAGGPAGGPPAAALSQVIAHVQEDGFDALMSEVISRRAEIAAFLTGPGGPDAAWGRLKSRLGLKRDDDRPALCAAVTSAMEGNRLRQLADWLDQGGANDRKMAERLREAQAAAHGEARLGAWFDVFFTATMFAVSRKPRAALYSKKSGQADPDLAAFLDHERDRLTPLYECWKALAVFEASRALFALAIQIAERFTTDKQAQGRLDYDDLILRCVALLKDVGAGWVLYKLDGGLDHVLVDEAQDTSAAQWQLIELLTGEFFAGHGAARAGGPGGAAAADRTIFAVGDEKQSIYSFQGAVPERFDTMNRAFAARARAAGKAFAKVPLTISFRSAEAILWAVDKVFESERARVGLAAGNEVLLHHSGRPGEAGRIDIWPTVTPDEQPETDPWRAPLDWQSPASPRTRLAEKIAAEIARWLAEKQRLPGGRLIEAGDILVLVRRRDRFVDALVRALKQRDVPVAGADRMILSSQIAIMDLIALARAAVMPEDDLTFACVLKSPLIGLSEDQLFELAHDRGTISLWRRLRALAAENNDYARALDRLGHWFNHADYMTPFEFFSTVLSADGARADLFERLGAQVNDPLDEFLALALDYERQNTPSLEGFVAWFGNARGEIKRDLAQTRGEVRIMTVHGAKGLEANIVILPDTCTVPDRRHELAQAAREAEYRRLLYVAMTRARDWLIVTGHEDARGRREDCWYDLVFEALTPHLDEMRGGDGEVTGWTRIDGGTSQDQGADHIAAESTADQLPAWTGRPPVREAPALTFEAPSGLVAKTTASRQSESESAENDTVLDAAKRGLLVHALLQSLPDLAPEARIGRMTRFLAQKRHGLSASDQAEIRAEVEAVLNHRDCAVLFGPDARAEVTVAGRLLQPGEAEDRALLGRIDRMAMLDDKLVIADFKTDRTIPSSPDQVPEGYLVQLAAYRALLRDLDAARPVECALVWTRGVRYMVLPDDLLAQALSAVTGS